jgi:sodium/bile acid cotransporter 7
MSSSLSSSSPPAAAAAAAAASPPAPSSPPALPPSSASAASPPPPPPSFPRLRRFLVDQHLPLGLVVFSLLGLLIPAPGRALAATPLNSVSLIGIFFLSGLGLKTDELRAAFAAVPAYAFGFFSILAASPCLGFALAGPAFDFLGPPEFKRGLALFAIMPTTVSSGLVMTAEAGGNTALAVLFSVGTNLAGIVTVPLFLAAVMGSAADGGLDPGKLILNLGLVILLPLAAGKALREASARARDFAAANKLRLKVLSSALLISVPWMSMSAASDDIGRAAPGNLVALAVLGVLLHALLLAFNWAGCALLNRAGLRIALREEKVRWARERE